MHRLHVAVTDQVWADFRALAANEPISTVLGDLVEREVDRYRARRLKAGQLDDTELVDALDHAHELHDDLAPLVARLERRLDHQPHTGRSGPLIALPFIRP